MESHLRAVVAALWSFDYRAISGTTTPQFGPAVAAGADLRAWWPEQQLGGGGLGGVVEVAADEDRCASAQAPARAVVAQSRRAGGLGGAAVQRVDGVAGPLGLVAWCRTGRRGSSAAWTSGGQVSARTLDPRWRWCTVTASAPRPSWVMVVPSSATCTWATTRRGGPRPPRRRSGRRSSRASPTRIGWEGIDDVRGERAPVQRALRALDAQGLEGLGVARPPGPRAGAGAAAADRPSASCSASPSPRRRSRVGGLTGAKRFLHVPAS